MKWVSSLKEKKKGYQNNLRLKTTSSLGSSVGGVNTTVASLTLEGVQANGVRRLVHLTVGPVTTCSLGLAISL